MIIKNMVNRVRMMKGVLLSRMHLVDSAKGKDFRNTLTREMAEEICVKLNNAFPEERVKVSDLNVVVGLFNDIRNTITGRIGNDVDDYIINYFMRKAAAKEFDPADPVYAQVEIGVFFGGGIIIMINALKSLGCRHTVIGIDPLNGYYMQDNSDYSSKRDIMTNLPIDLETVKMNIGKCGLSLKNIVFVKDYSQSENALREACKYKIASIYIDGDHSYEGLKRDFDNYFNFVAPGGYILIDNYKDNHGLNHFWPDVTKFIECELVPFNDLFRIILIHNRCVLLKKIK